MKTRPHPVHFAGAAWWVAFVALVGTLMIRHNELSASGEWNVLIGCIAAAVAGLIGPWWRWSRTSVALDGSLVRWESGSFGRTLVELDLARAREVTVDEDTASRLLGYGRCRIVDETGTTYVLPPLGMESAEIIASRWSERLGTRRARRDG